MRIAVTGASGMLGAAVLERLSGHCELFANGRKAGAFAGEAEWRLFDLGNHDLSVQWLRDIRPDAVVHCAAIVDVDFCEKNPLAAERMHVGATRVLAEALSEWGGRMIYVSTDSVFNGMREGMYTEADEADPGNVYAKTKREGERVALGMPGGTVLRTNIFGWTPGNRVSFAEWVLKGLVSREPLGMFTDVWYTPIHVSHLSDLIHRVLVSGLSGLFHAGGSQALSKHAFALEMGAVFGLDTGKVTARKVEEAGLTAPRPKNMMLANGRLAEALGCGIPGAGEGLALMQRQYASGWVEILKGRPVPGGYRFWER